MDTVVIVLLVLGVIAIILAAKGKPLLKFLRPWLETILFLIIMFSFLMFFQLTR